jgi:hypothetical protein
VRYSTGAYRVSKSRRRELAPRAGASLMRYLGGCFKVPGRVLSSCSAPNHKSDAPATNFKLKKFAAVVF